MTLEEATATSPTWKRRVGNDHEQQTFYVAIQIIGKYLLFINYLFINHLS